MHPPAISKATPTPTPSLQPHHLARKRDTSKVTRDMKARAEICYGDEICREKFMLLLREIGLPNGLLTLEEIEECGHVRDTGFVWLKHKKKRDYYRFENILVYYDTEVTAYFERNKIKNLTGVKTREFFTWITLSEIYVNDNHRTAAASSSTITFKNPVGLSKTFPLSLFQFEAIVTQEGVKEVDEAKQGRSIEERRVQL